MVPVMALVLCVYDGMRYGYGDATVWCEGRVVRGTGAKMWGEGMVLLVRGRGMVLRYGAKVC